MKRVPILFFVLILVALNFSNLLMARSPEVDPPPHVEILSLVNHQKVAVGQAVLLEAHGSNPDWFIGEYWFYANDVLIGQVNPTVWRPNLSGSVVITCVVKRDPAHPVISEPLTIQVADPPVMKLIEPQSSVVLSAPASLDLEVGASAVGGVIRRVRFLDGTQEVGSVTNPPYRLHVNSLHYRRLIKAVAEDDSGLATELVFPVTILGMPGDEFFRPLQLSGEHAVDHVSNRDASDQVVAGWAPTALAAAGKSMWWKWIAPSDGTVTISTAGSNFDTVLGVLVSTNKSGQLSFSHLMTSYNGAVVAPSSAVKFQVLKGLEYRIVVDASNGGFGGDIQLKLDLSPSSGNGIPANDPFVVRELLTGQFLPQSFNTLGASIESNERSIVTNVPGGRSVWWEWRPVKAGVATITTRGSAFDTVLGVYTLIGNNPALSSLRLLVANDDDPEGGSHSTVRFVADPSVQYMIAVDGFWGLGGAGVLTLDLDSQSVLSPPVNDSIGRRIRIPENQLIQYATASRARNDPEAPLSMNTAVWWGWTPVVDQTAVVTTEGSASTTQVGIYYFDEMGALRQQVLRNGPLVSEGNLRKAEASFVALAGREYIIGVAAIGPTKSEGEIQMRVIPGPVLQGLPLIAYGADPRKGIEMVSLGLDTPRRALLLESSDLVNWRLIRTNAFEPGIPLELPFEPAAMKFLKAYEWNNP